jgi:hypothetical protein
MVFIVASIHKNVTSVLRVDVKILSSLCFKMWEIQRHMTPI